MGLWEDASTTFTCAAILTRSLTSETLLFFGLVCRLVLNPLSHTSQDWKLSYFFKKFLILIGGNFSIAFLKSKGERERERNTNVRETHRSVASSIHPNQGSNPHLGMCTDWELNRQPCGVWDDALTN